MTVQEPLSVGSWNVRWDNPDDGAHRWEERRERLAALLRAWAPDVLGIQEPYHHQLEFLRQALPEYEAVGVGRNDGVAAGEFCPILYRRTRFQSAAVGTFWLSEEPDRPGSMAWGARHPRICTWTTLVERETNASFSVYNVHLDHESQTAREKGVGLLLGRLRQRAGLDPVIVLGDFNAEPENRAVRQVQAEEAPALRNALAAVSEGTFHGFTGEAPHGPIDYILHSPEWRVLSAEVLHGDGSRPFPSDHFPVSAVLQLTRRTGAGEAASYDKVY